MDNTIAIRTWQNEIVVPRDHPSPARVRADIEATTEQVAEVLAEGIDAYIERKAGEIILIRRLVFDCDIDTRCDRREAARALAQRCASALIGAVESRSAEVVRFPSRSAFVARFVEDLASGHAWGQWYYACFDGVRVLPVEAAIRTVLLEDPLVGREALAAIRPDVWPALARCLSGDEAARILEGLAEDTEESFACPNEARWLAALSDPALAAISTSASVLALLLYTASLREHAAGSRVEVHAARALAAIVMLMRLDAHAAVEALLEGDVRGLASVEPRLAANLAMHFAGANGAALRSLAATAHEMLRKPATEPSISVSTSSLAAPFAGLGLLLEEIDLLLDAELAATLPEMDGAPSRELAALTAIAIAAGGEHARLVWYDASWREFLGIAPALQWNQYAEVFTATTADSAHRAQRVLGATALQHLRGTAISTALRVRGSRLHCVADDSNGLWLSLRSDDRDPPSALPTSFRARLAAARRAAADWRALDDDTLSASLPLEWSAVFIACAQTAWRRLAQRVPGMRGASIRYLRDNLLGVGGTATRLAPDHWRWSSHRAPLHVLLNLAGMARSTQTWRGPPERRFEWEFT